MYNFLHKLEENILISASLLRLHAKNIEDPLAQNRVINCLILIKIRISPILLHTRLEKLHVAMAYCYCCKDPGDDDDDDGERLDLVVMPCLTLTLISVRAAT